MLEHVRQGLLHDAVDRQVSNLIQLLRLPLHLHYGEGYSTEEIAGLLDIPAATVRTRLRRARNRLKDSLGGDDHEE